MNFREFQKGAMFGLDARIALAIFGALSVISGAALYNAIQQSKATALITDLNEIGKAWEQYYLDTGEDLPVRGDALSSWRAYSYNTSFLLVDSGAAGWNGPYLPYYVDAEKMIGPKYGVITMHKVTDDEVWGLPTTEDWQPAGMCTAGKSCSAWVTISGFEDQSLIKKVDEMIDGSDGGNKGKIRYDKPTITPDVKNRIWLKYAPIKNPND